MIGKIKKLLDLIIETTYPDKKIFPYYLKIENKNLKSKNGHWQLKEKDKFATISIFNLERGTKEILKTNIHEIAHNMEYSLHGNTGHTKRFYLIYRNLLETAIRLGLLTFEEIKDLYDIQQLTAVYGPITAKPNSLKELINDKLIIKINKSFSVKDTLKRKGYTYNGLEQNWIKEVKASSLEEELEYLYTITDKANVVVTQIKDIEIQAMGYIVVDNCYDYKDELKNDGYIYRGYNHNKGSKWIKKIYIKDKQEELDKLKNMKNIVAVVELINNKQKKYDKKAKN